MDLNRTKALIDNKIVWTASIPTAMPTTDQL